MAPAFAVPGLLAHHGLRCSDIGLWENHVTVAAPLALDP
jgi:acetyl-CoA acetyltransferase